MTTTINSESCPCLVGEICAGRGTTRDYLEGETIGEHCLRTFHRISDPLPERLVEAFIRRLETSPELAQRLREALGAPAAESPQTIPVQSDIPPAIARAHRGAVATRTRGRRHSA